MNDRETGRPWGSILLIPLFAAGLACSDSSTMAEDNNDNGVPFQPPPVASGLRPESDLVSNCYNWPAQPFTTEDHVEVVRAALAEGEDAIEFTLKDPDGVEYQLSELLETKPVYLVFGAYT